MKIWRTKNVISLVLFPLSILFYLITWIRRKLYVLGILKSYRASIPVLVVGNISVGGNGKTPVVVWLVEQLKQKGIRVGVVSRGYGGKNKQFPQLVNATSSAEQMGDEPVLIAQRTGVPVAISPNRAESIALLLAQFELDLIITDDGLQHYALQRDMEWVVIDGERRFGNGFLLPAGGLRELPSRLNEVQAVICNGKNAKKGEYSMSLNSAIAINLKNQTQRPLSDFQQTQNVAMAGIGYPPRFFAMLESLRIPLQSTYAFADHQAFEFDHLSSLANESQQLLMTEKDAVKCKTFAQENWWYIPVNAEIEQGEQLIKSVIALVEAGK